MIHHLKRMTTIKSSSFFLHIFSFHSSVLALHFLVKCVYKRLNVFIIFLSITL
nr:MAG TPA: hypothetical protein [Caudoviricetes sp.]